VTGGTDHILWVGASSWDGIPGTDRPLAEAMRRYARILYVDTPISPMTEKRWGAKRRIRPVLSKIDDRITRLTPVALPGMTRPIVRATTTPLLRAQIRWALRRTGIKPRAVVATHLEDVLGRYDGAVNVLYPTDDWVAGAELMGLPVGRLRMQERRALSRSDVVTVTSPYLAEYWSALGADPVLVPNGCPPIAEGLAQPPTVAQDLPGPVVGLIGQLTDRIDMSILEAIGDAGYSLLIVGPHDPRWAPDRLAALVARPLVRYVGPVPVEEVPGYLAAIDVGITPYRDSTFNKASFPMKTLEYLSGGLPVVSTALPAAKWLQDDIARTDQQADADGILKLADQPAEFVAALRQLVGEPGSDQAPRLSASQSSTARAARCREHAERHTWSRRADTFAEVIGLL
jgi:teichuronic acid biosynthesis glycosyltransferase TuaH